MVRNQSKHDLYVDYLLDKLSKLGKYDVIDTHVFYPDKESPVGECDVLGIIYKDKGMELHYYEVKSSEEHYKRAMRQLTKFKDYFRTEDYITHGFVYIGKKDLLKQVF